MKAPPPMPELCGSTSVQHHLHRHRGVDRAAALLQHLAARLVASGLAATTMKLRAVLSHMLDRFARTNRLRLAHNAEFVALSRVGAQLDKILVEPFMARYEELLLAARARVSEGFEGLGPGVEPREDSGLSR
jgi:hypothetical protein